MRKKVLIVGAGPGGLSAAILLAAAGLEVKIIERLHTVGGRTSTIQSNGFQIRSGSHFFPLPERLGRDLPSRECRSSARGRTDSARPPIPNPFRRRGHLDCTSDIARMEESIATISPNDAPAFRRFIGENRLKFSWMKPFLASPFQKRRIRNSEPTSPQVAEHQTPNADVSNADHIKRRTPATKRR
jgi:phytoene desaturase